MNDSYIQIGHTGKPHGIAGELKIVVKERYERDALQANVLFLDLKGSPVPFFVEDLSIGNAWIVKLEDVDSREHANSISGKGIFLRQTDLMPPEAADPDAEPDYELLVGYHLIDNETGPVGPIEAVYDLGTQTLAGVRYQDREVLVPLHPHLIVDIREDVGELVMDLPLGLLEL